MKQLVRVSSAWGAWGILFSLGIAVAAPSPGFCQQDDALAKARDRYKEGRAAYTARDYPTAVARFEEAYSLKPNAKLLFLLAKAYDQMGKSGPALRYLRDYAHSSPEAAVEVKEQLALYERVVFKKVRDRAEASLSDAADLAAPGHRHPGSHAVAVDTSAPVFEDVPVGIYSEPPGAKVYIDDREWGVQATTPHNMRIFAGKHTLWIEKDFYVGKSLELFVRPVLEDGKPQTISVQLEREIVPVEIKTRPASAEIVYIKETGERMTLGKGRFKGNLPAGPAKFVVQAPGEGQQTFDESIVGSRVDEGGTLFLNFDLRAGHGATVAAATTGQLVVSGYLIGADVIVDGKSIGQTPGPLTLPLAPGPHQLLLTKDGHKSWSHSFRVEVDETTRVTTPESLPKASGGAGWFGWTLVGTSVALAGAGGFMTWQALGARDDADGALARGDDDASTLSDDADQKELISYGLYGASGAAALVGVLVIATSASPDDTIMGHLNVEWSAYPGGGMVLFMMPWE